MIFKLDAKRFIEQEYMSYIYIETYILFICALSSLLDELPASPGDLSLVKLFLVPFVLIDISLMGLSTSRR